MVAQGGPPRWSSPAHFALSLRGAFFPGGRRNWIQFPGVYVSDLRRFLDLPEDAPAPARNLADHFGNIVRAATAGGPGPAWVSALPCRRRPGRSRCPGRIVVFRSELPAQIEWGCDSCDDEGVISGWEGTQFDLRTPRPIRHLGAAGEVLVPDEVAAALRTLTLLDLDCQRLVYRATALDEGVALLADEEQFDELLGHLAAEANHEPNRRRQQRLDRSLAVLSSALREAGA